MASTSVSAGPSERLSTTKKKSSTSQKHAQTPQTSQKQKSRESTNTCDDIEMLEKSKRVLEAKSQFYDRMSRSGGCPEPNDSCLVMFGQKQIKNASVSKSFDRYEVEDRSSSCSSTKNNNAELLLHNTSHIGNSADDDCEDENWVEYTDCLGRSRRCLKEDLSAIKQRDIELARTVAPKLTNRISVSFEKPINKYDLRYDLFVQIRSNIQVNGLWTTVALQPSYPATTTMKMRKV